MCQSILGILFIHLCSWIPLPWQSQISMVLPSADQLFPSSYRRSEWREDLNARDEGFALRRHEQFGGCIPLQQSHPARLCHVVRGPESLPSETWKRLNRVQGYLSLSLAVRGPPHKIGTWNCVADSQPFWITAMTRNTFFPSNGNASCLAHLPEKSGPMFLVKWIVKIFGEEFDRHYLATLMCFGILEQLFAGMEKYGGRHGACLQLEYSRKEDRELCLEIQRQVWSCKV